LSNISCSHHLELAGTGWSWLEPAGAGWNLDLTAKFSLQGSLMAVATAEITQNQINFFTTSKYIALIKKKIKFSSYIRKFRMEQLQSHI
jgi:hypothetical protein